MNAEICVALKSVKVTYNEKVEVVEAPSHQVDNFLSQIRQVFEIAESDIIVLTTSDGVKVSQQDHLTKILYAESNDREEAGEDAEQPRFTIQVVEVEHALYVLDEESKYMDSKHHEDPQNQPNESSSSDSSDSEIDLLETISNRDELQDYLRSQIRDHLAILGPAVFTELRQEFNAIQAETWQPQDSELMALSEHESISEAPDKNVYYEANDEEEEKREEVT